MEFEILERIKFSQSKPTIINLHPCDLLGTVSKKKIFIVIFLLAKE